MGACQRLCGNAMDDTSAKKPDDFVIASGNEMTVREFVGKALEILALV